MRSYQRFWPSPKIGATYRAGDGAQSGQQAQAGAAMRSWASALVDWEGLATWASSRDIPLCLEHILLPGHLAMITQTDQFWILPCSSSPSPVKFFLAEATDKFSFACLKQRLMATWRMCFQRCVYICMSPCRFHINVFQECKGLVGYNVGTPFANEDNQVAETPLSCHHCWGKVWRLASRRS